MRLAWVLGEFSEPRALIVAAHRLRELGYRNVETYSPYPLDELSESLGLRGSRVPAFVLIGGMAGATLGYLMQFYTNVIDFPINVGGRPLHAAPSFIPI